MTEPATADSLREAAAATMPETPEQSALAPFASRVFLVLWTATVVSNIGGWLRDTASGWIMTGLTASPTLIALVQAATTLPVFLFALPAGALSDIVDRRRMLIAIQAGLGLLSVTFGVLAILGALTPAALLALSFLAGLGTALTAPAWQSVVPELVGKEQLRSAVALNSLGINVSRAIGPALGGVILVAFGGGAAYFAAVATYVVAIAALAWWPRKAGTTGLPPESLSGATRAGVRYALASPDLQRILVRAGMFFVFGSALWALLPLVVRHELGGDAGLYGIMLGAIGAGAIAGALVLPQLRARLGAEGVMTAATLGTAGVLVIIALGPSEAFAIALMSLAGAAWIAALTTLNATAQGVLPNWVRGRGLAVYLTVFYGAMTAGSVGWGALAEATSVPVALIAAGVLGAGAWWLGRRWALPAGEADLTPSHHWPEPLLANPQPGDRGPVLVQVAYEVAPEDAEAFRAAMAALSGERRRNGAHFWELFEDAAQPGRYTEVFMEASWSEHIRHHGRVTGADANVQARVRAFHRGAEPPRISHLLAAREATEVAR